MTGIGTAKVGHHKNVCQYGTVHGQCRCPAKDKATVKINCPTPDKCIHTASAPAQQGKPGRYVEDMAYAFFVAGVKEFGQHHHPMPSEAVLRAVFNNVWREKYPLPDVEATSSKSNEVYMTLDRPKVEGVDDKNSVPRRAMEQHTEEDLRRFAIEYGIVAEFEDLDSIRTRALRADLLSDASHRSYSREQIAGMNRNQLLRAMIEDIAEEVYL